MWYTWNIFLSSSPEMQSTDCPLHCLSYLSGYIYSVNNNNKQTTNNKKHKQVATKRSSCFYSRFWFVFNLSSVGFRLFQLYFRVDLLKLGTRKQNKQTNKQTISHEHNVCVCVCVLAAVGPLISALKLRQCAVLS